MSTIDPKLLTAPLHSGPNLAQSPDVPDERILDVHHYPEDGTTTHLWVGVDRHIYLSSTICVGRMPSPPAQTWTPPTPQAPR